MTNDQIGRLSELVAARDLSWPVRGRYKRPLFRATPLGDKYPTVDFLVDILDRKDASRGFFFAQVKGTASATPTQARLPVEVKADRYNLLVRLPAPTFLIGVDVVAEKSYLVATPRARQIKVSSISKDYCLRDDAVKIGLYTEIIEFWRLNRPLLRKTRYRDVY
jgi:hypothetical protein